MLPPGLDRLGDLVAVDTETTGLHRWLGHRPFSLPLCDEQGAHWYHAWKVDPATRRVSVPPKDVEALNRFFSSGRRFVFWHGKFDVSMLASIGVRVPEGSWDDAMVGFKCLRTDEFAYGLKPLAKKYAEYPDDDEKELRDSTVSGRALAKTYGYPISEDVEGDYCLADPAIVHAYARGDVERTMLLWMLVRDKLKDEGLLPLYQMEMDLQGVVLRMEERGVRVDRDRIQDASVELSMLIQRERGKMARLAGFDFNPASYKQKVQYFMDAGVTLNRLTPKGYPSTDATALGEIDHPMALLILEWMNLTKQFQFFRAWEKILVEEGGEWFIHPTFNPHAARTGRFSCSDPNLQQVPKRDPVAGARARACFIPREGHLWIPADYSQMELRLLAWLGREEAMRRVFRENGDIHLETAVRVFGKATDTNRRDAKDVNFGIVYGAGADTLANTIGCKPADAARFIRNYKQGYPGVDRFMAESIVTARTHGYIETPFGRRIHVSPTARYKATNYAIQGTGADVTKRAMIELDRQLGDRAPLVLQIHDEVVLETAAAGREVFEIARKVKKVMEEAGGDADPVLEVDVSLVDENWADKADLVL